MPIKSFRGRVADQAQQKISLHTNNGSIGYKIVKFQVIGQQPSAQTQEGTVKVYSVPQTTFDSVIDFSDNTLLAVGVFGSEANLADFPFDTIIIFDNMIVNQDIYVTNKGTNLEMNYYIELEQVKLSLDENTVATLKDIRNIQSQ